ncbi:uncharacterized protein LOC111134320 isoform X2 [Crassostrea virginica]
MSSTEESENRSAEKQSVPIGSTSLSINISFVKSLLGIFQGVVIILSVICLICAGAGANLSCDYTYGSNYGFYEFVAGTVLLTYFIDYIIFAISIDEQWCMKFIPWLLWHFVTGIVFTFLYFIASIVMASHVCGRSGYAAASVFGFITTVVLGVETYFLLMSLRRDHAPSDNKVLNMLGVPPSNCSSPQSPDYDPESVPDTKY